jgi:hypothetical protein
MTTQSSRGLGGNQPLLPPLRAQDADAGVAHGRLQRFLLQQADGTLSPVLCQQQHRTFVDSPPDPAFRCLPSDQKGAPVKLGVVEDEIGADGTGPDLGSQRIRVNVLSAKDVAVADFVSSDPYCAVFWGGKHVGSTGVRKRTLNPTVRRLSSARLSGK